MISTLNNEIDEDLGIDMSDGEIEEINVCQIKNLISHA